MDRGVKGNFPELVKLADKLPVFPAIKNQRSMLFIENLCMYLKEIIDEEKNGSFSRKITSMSGQVILYKQ